MAVVQPNTFLSSAVLIANAEFFSGMFTNLAEFCKLSLLHFPPPRYTGREMEQELKLMDDYLLTALATKDT